MTVIDSDSTHLTKSGPRLTTVAIRSPRLRGESNSQILTFRSIYNAFLITEDDILRLDLGPDWLVLTADRGRSAQQSGL
jgi:hypothetical protein